MYRASDCMPEVCIAYEGWGEAFSLDNSLPEPRQKWISPNSSNMFAWNLAQSLPDLRFEDATHEQIGISKLASLSKEPERK